MAAIHAQCTKRWHPKSRFKIKKNAFFAHLFFCFLLDFWCPLLVQKNGPSLDIKICNCLRLPQVDDEKWDHFLVPKTGTKNHSKITFFLPQKYIFLLQKIESPDTKNCNLPSQRNQPDPLANANAAVRGTHQVGVNRQNFDCNA